MITVHQFATPIEEYGFDTPSYNPADYVYFFDSYEQHGRLNIVNFNFKIPPLLKVSYLIEISKLSIEKKRV
jgi:hypothetical protein